jgi:DNA polymerase-1
MDKDCWKTNALICRTPNNRKPTVKEINCCRPNLYKTIEETKPEKIFLFGKTALQSIIAGRESVTDIEKWVGRKIPDRKWNTWLYPMYHPAYLIRNPDDNVIFNLFGDHLEEAIRHKPTEPLSVTVRTLHDPYGASIWLEGVNKLPGHPIAFDIETIGLSPYTDKAKILSISFSNTKGLALSFPFFEDRGFQRELRRLLQGPTKKIAHNIKFEDKWILEKCGYQVKNWYWDTMIGAHILDNKPKVSGLKFQGGVKFGYLGYDEKVKKYIKDMSKCPVDDMLHYNGMDSGITYLLYLDQIGGGLGESKGFQLFMEGIQVLNEMEINGIHIDEEYYYQTIKRLSRQVEHITQSIKKDKIIQEKGFEDFNPNSPQQLQKLLFDKLGFKPKKLTPKEQPSVDISVLERINHPIAKKIVQMRKIEKISGTFLSNIMEHSSKGFLHPSFDLHTTRSMRSSASGPNFQNLPKRDEWAQKTVRSGIIPRKGNLLLEVDYSGVEVRIGACNHKDPVMIDYIHDPSTDMHRDQAKELFLKEDVTKEERYLAKNGFVFPEFYGSYFVEIAPNLWKNMSLETRKHLGDNGITNYQRFERHVEMVEKKLWNERFVVYNQWKIDEWEKFQKCGYVDLYTGFRLSGIMRRNQVLNIKIQGPAFHCLLWSAIQTSKYLKKEKMGTVLAGQIHDSMFLDVVPEELETLYPAIRRISCEDIRKEWKWIIVPLDVEATVSEVDGNWFRMKNYEIEEKSVQNRK